jgi:CRP/FNR family transcriptional regulator
MQRLPSNLSDRLETLRSCRYFSGVNERILEILAQDTNLQRYQAGETIFWEGNDCAGLHIIHRGSVKLFKISPRGRQMVIKIFKDGDSFNEVPIFDGGANPVNVAAISECEIWVVGCKTIRKAIEEHPEMSRAIIQNLSENLRMLVGLVEELSFYQVTNRLARLISQMPDEQLTGKGTHRLTQDEMAARLGTVREVVARSLKELERSGAIQASRGKIKITNNEILGEWAQFPEH